MLHVYETFGIVRARQLPFWIDFRQRHPTEDLPSPRDLRAMFFGEVLPEPEHYEDLPYEVVQYLNPLFNNFDPAVLEAGDVIEGKDFQFNVPDGLREDGPAEMTFEQLTEYVNQPTKLITRNVPLAPLEVQLVNTASRSEEDDLSHRFEQVLSEIVWTEEEKIEKPVLELAEIRARVVTLAKSGIALLDIIEPSMECYRLINGTSEIPEAVPAEEQIVPVSRPATRPAVTGKSGSKRWWSFDDSGLGASPSKRSRLLTPNTISARKARLRRIVSTPGDI